MLFYLFFGVVRVCGLVVGYCVCCLSIFGLLLCYWPVLLSWVGYGCYLVVGIVVVISGL